MRARDLAEPFPVVTLDTDAHGGRPAAGRETAARSDRVRRRRAALHRAAGLAGAAVHHPQLRQEDLALARVYDEQASDELLRQV